MPDDRRLSSAGTPVVDDGAVVWSQTGPEHPSEVMLYVPVAGRLQSLSAGSPE